MTIFITAAVHEKAQWTVFERPEKNYVPPATSLQSCSCWHVGSRTKMWIKTSLSALEEPLTWCSFICPFPTAPFLCEEETERERERERGQAIWTGKGRKRIGSRTGGLEGRKDVEWFNCSFIFSLFRFSVNLSLDNLPSITSTSLHLSLASGSSQKTPLPKVDSDPFARWITVVVVAWERRGRWGLGGLRERGRGTVCLGVKSRERRRVVIRASWALCGRLSRET